MWVFVPIVTGAAVRAWVKPWRTQKARARGVFVQHSKRQMGGATGPAQIGNMREDARAHACATVFGRDEHQADPGIARVGVAEAGIGDGGERFARKQTGFQAAGRIGAGGRVGEEICGKAGVGGQAGFRHGAIGCASGKVGDGGGICHGIERADHRTITSSGS